MLHRVLLGHAKLSSHGLGSLSIIQTGIRHHVVGAPSNKVIFVKDNNSNSSVPSLPALIIVDILLLHAILSGALEGRCAM